MNDANRSPASDDRSVSRNDVSYRVRGFGPSAEPLTLRILNMSALGLMAYRDAPLQPGDRLRLTLPVVGVVAAEVRWVKEDRLGCELDRPIPLGNYYEMLATMIEDI